MHFDSVRSLQIRQVKHLVRSQITCSTLVYLLISAQLLLLSAVDVYASRSTELIASVMNKDPDAVANALKEGANVNARAVSNGAVPLVIAVQLNHMEIVKLLIKSGAKINIQADNGGTPIYAAAAYADLAIVSMIVEHGANVDALSGGMTPLFVAAQKNRTAIVKKLLDVGADPNIKAANGATVLMQAAKHGNVSMVKALLDKGAITGIKVKGWSALRIAQKKGYHKVVRLLETAI